MRVSLSPFGHKTEGSCNMFPFLPALGHDKAQSIIDQITSAYESGGGPPPGGFGFGPQHLTPSGPGFVPPPGFGGGPPQGFGGPTFPASWFYPNVTFPKDVHPSLPTVQPLVYPRVDLPFPHLTLVGLMHHLHLILADLLYLLVTQDPLQMALHLQVDLLCLLGRLLRLGPVECTLTDCV